MAMIADARVLLDLVGKCTAFAQQTASGWYKASEAMRLFPIKLATLEQQSNSWVSLLNRHGLRDDPLIAIVLAQAIKLLEGEQRKLEQLQQSCCSTMWRKLIFPESLTGALESVIQAFQNLPQMIRDQEEARQAVEMVSLSQAARLPFLPDRKYVPLTKSILEVRDALERETSGPVVAICGGSGQGKSSLARYLACLYQEGIDRIRPTENRQGQILNPEICGPKWFGDGVFFFHCGVKADSKYLLSQLWQELGYQPLPTPNDQGPGTATDEMSIKLESDLLRQLSSRLTNQELLIILDDVWDASIIEKVLVQRPGIKYLITTQIQRLWVDASCPDIRISRPTHQEANKILRNHVHGFPEEVGSDVQNQIDIIIRKSDGNPLVLANVATNIDHGTSLEEWRNASKYFSDLQDGDNKRPVSLYGRSYSKKTMGASIEMALSVFSTEIQTLLFIASMCEVQPIPEVVFKILFKCVHSSLAKFSRCSQQLETSDFIRIEKDANLGNSVSKKSWIMHSTRHNFISLLKHHEMDLMFMRLLGKIDNRDPIVLILLVLYGQGRWCEHAKEKLGIPMNDRNSKLWSSSLPSIKPLVWLLYVDEDKEWEERSHHLVKEVLCKYLLSNDLDDHYMSKLLALPHATSVGCKVLHAMTHSNQGHFLQKKHQKVIRILISLLLCPNHNPQLGDEVTLQVDILTALGCLSQHQVDNAIDIGACPGALERLMTLLGEEIIPSVQLWAAWTIGHLSGQVVDNAIRIGTYPGTLERLIAPLGEEATPRLQECAAWTLGKLSQQVLSNAIKIGSYPHALERLIALLGEEATPSVQQWAASTLGELSQQVIANAIKIGSYPDALERLIALLGKEATPSVQQKAAWTLGQLSKQVVENAIKIGNYPGTFERLIALLGEEATPSAQECAAWTLGQLSKQVVENAIKIGNYPGTFERLIALLGEEATPSAQECAAWTLGQLSQQVLDNAIRIGRHPHALERLTTLLGKKVIPSVQQKVACTLGQLSAQVVDNAIKIGGYPHALERLIALLGEEVTPNVQEFAAWTLGQLSKQVLDNAIRIGSYPHALERLIALLREKATPSVQERAAWTLGQLSEQVLDNAIKIGGYPHALDRLIALLGEQATPSVQEWAAWTLGELSKQVVDNAIKIGSYPYALERLIALLGEEATPSVQEKAAWTLGELSQQVLDNAIKIGSYPHALGRLIALLREEDTPSVQEKAAWTLGKLSKQVMDIASKIGTYPGALERLVALLEGGCSLQFHGAQALCHVYLKKVENQNLIREAFLRNLNAWEGLVCFATSEKYEDGRYCYLQYWGGKLYTLANIESEMNGIRFKSSKGCQGKGDGKLDRGEYKGALEAYDDGLAIEAEDTTLLSKRCFAKAKLGDFEGALKDADRIIEIGNDRPFGLQERGVVKRLKGDLNGSLADLNEGLELETDDYETLKHRALVKFLLKDEDGARADAEWALQVKPPRIDINDYGSGAALGVSSVEFLDYKLK